MIYKIKIICIFLLIHFSSSATVKTPLILNDIVWPPFFFNNDEQSFKGIAKEILDKCIDPQKYRQKFIKLPIKRTHFYMQSGEIDISVYSYKKNREASVIYSKQPMFSSEYGFVVREGSNIEINKLSDLSPYVIGHLAGLSHTPEILQIIEQKRLSQQVYDGYHIDDMFKQLLAHKPRFDVMINSKETFYWRAKALGITSKISVLDYQIKRKKYFLTVSKASKNIKDKEKFLNNFDTCIIDLKKQGEYQRILKKYGA